ncbi:MAG: SgcJ/EcaC family oxidoreductase [Acidobacteriota bacterium]|nr:SgcJ/EcaC family oxidoreductase [Acidobacteriota bacterium]
MEDEQAVRKVVSDFADAWNGHDAKVMGALHTEDVNFVNIFGQWWKGRKEVEDSLARAHAIPFAKKQDANGHRTG